MKKHSKKILLYIFAILIIIVVLMSIKLFSAFSSLESAFEPQVITKEIIFESINKTLYLRAKSWGVAGNHYEITLSTQSFETKNWKLDSKKEYMFYTTELYYRKQGLDTLGVYVSSSAIGNIPNYFSKNIIVLIHALNDYDEIQKYENNYKALGLEKISVYK